MGLTRVGEDEGSIVASCSQCALGPGRACLGPREVLNLLCLRQKVRVGKCSNFTGEPRG